MNLFPRDTYFIVTFGNVVTAGYSNALYSIPNDQVTIQIHIRFDIQDNEVVVFTIYSTAYILLCATRRYSKSKSTNLQIDNDKAKKSKDFILKNF